MTEINYGSLEYDYLPPDLRATLGDNNSENNLGLASTLINMLNTHPSNVREYLNTALGNADSVSTQKLTDLAVDILLEHGNTPLQAVFCLLESAYSESSVVKTQITEVRLAFAHYYNTVVESGDTHLITLSSGLRLADVLPTWQHPPSTAPLQNTELISEVMESVLLNSNVSLEAWLLYLAGSKPGSWKQLYPIAHQILDKLTQPRNTELKPLLHLGESITKQTARQLLMSATSGSLASYLELSQYYELHASSFQNTEQVLAYARWLKKISTELHIQLDLHIPDWMALSKNEFLAQLATDHLKERILDHVRVTIPNFMFQ